MSLSLSTIRHPLPQRNLNTGVGQIAGKGARVFQPVTKYRITGWKTRAPLNTAMCQCQVKSRYTRNTVAFAIDGNWDWCENAAHGENDEDVYYGRFYVGDEDGAAAVP